MTIIKYVVDLRHEKITDALLVNTVRYLDSENIPFGLKVGNTPVECRFFLVTESQKKEIGDQKYGIQLVTQL